LPHFRMFSQKFDDHVLELANVRGRRYAEINPSSLSPASHSSLQFETVRGGTEREVCDRHHTLVEIQKNREAGVDSASR
jgi:hypothetical protein